MCLGGLVVKILAMNGRGMSLNPSLEYKFCLYISLSHVVGIGENTLDLKFPIVNYHLLVSPFTKRKP